MAEPSGEDNRSPLLRFRTYPKKPFSVTDLTAGAWCELQYFYTLSRLPGGKKTRTAAMRKGTRIHSRLEREIFRPVKIDVTKREDSFGLKIWNMIEGLRVLRMRGVTREFEVWGIVHGNVVCGVIDGMSYDNPDLELQEDVLSSRGSQTITNSQPYVQNTPDGDQIFLTDVKTRNSTNPPPQSQTRVSLIQLFLYHRFISDMASDRLDYMRVFERYDVKPDEPFSNHFMDQLAVFQDAKSTRGNLDTDSDDTVSNGQMLNDDDTDSNNGEFVSAPSSPSQVSFADPAQASPEYHTLRNLLSLLKFELALTFPRGAADLGSIVAVEYRYRGRDPIDPKPNTTTPGLGPDEADPYPGPAAAAVSAEANAVKAAIGEATENDAAAAPSINTPLEPAVGSVICTNSFFVEPETLDLYLNETLRWWTGERRPRGVAPFEAGFKCRSCEFADDCSWRRDIDQEALHKARMKRLEREAEKRSRGRRQRSSGALQNEAERERESSSDDDQVQAQPQTQRQQPFQPQSLRLDELEEQEEEEMAALREIEAEERQAAAVDIEDIGKPVKRRRGRPRKNPEVPAKALDAKDPSEPPRRRGRPRKDARSKGKDV